MGLLCTHVVDDGECGEEIQGMDDEYCTKHNALYYCAWQVDDEDCGDDVPDNDRYKYCEYHQKISNKIRKGIKKARTI